MAVAFGNGTESHTGTVASISESSFSWTHTPTGTPAGILIFVLNVDSSVDHVPPSGVTWGGVVIPSVPGGVAVDTAGEQCRATAFFNGNASALAGRSGNTVTVQRTNDTVEMWAVAITVTASPAGDTEVYEPGIVLLEQNGTYSVQSVTDGSPGTNSVRFAGCVYGGSVVPPVGTGSTLVHNFDTGAQTASVVRETTAGQGARNVGWTAGTADDRAAVHLAVRDWTPTTINGSATGNYTSYSGVGAGQTFFPSVSDEVSSSSDSATTSHVVSIPSGSNGRLLMALSFPGEPVLSGTDISGWTKLGPTISDSVPDQSLYIYYRDTDPSGSTITITTDVSVRSAHHVWRITGAHTDILEISHTDGGLSVDPPALSPSWGAEDTLWFALCSSVNDSATTNFTVFPTNFEGTGQRVTPGTAADGVGLGWAWRKNAVASEDPSVFAGEAGRSVTATIAVRSAGNVGSVGSASGNYTITSAGAGVAVAGTANGIGEGAYNYSGIGSGIVKVSSWVNLPGGSGNSASTPDTAALDITGDITIQFDYEAGDETPASAQVILAKHLATGNQCSYQLSHQTSGALSIGISVTGADAGQTFTTSNANFILAGRHSYKVTLDLDNGSSQRVGRFYRSDDFDGSYSLFQTVTASGAISGIFSSTSPLHVSGRNNGTSLPAIGKMYALVIRDGLDGDLRLRWDDDNLHNGTPTVFTDDQGRTWTVNGTAAIQGVVVSGKAIGNYNKYLGTGGRVTHLGSASGSYYGTGIPQESSNIIEDRFLDLIRDVGSGSPSSNFRFLGGDVTDCWNTGGDDIAWCGSDWFAGALVDDDDTFSAGALPFRNGVLLETTPGTFASQIYANGTDGPWLNAETQGGEATGTHWWPIAAFNDSGTNRIFCWHMDGTAGQSTPWGTQVDSCIVTLNAFGGYASHVNLGFGAITQRFWVDGVLPDTTYTYIYGEEFVPDYDADVNNDGSFPNYGKTDPENHFTLKRIARAPNASVTTVSTWEFWDGREWNTSILQAVPMVDTDGNQIHGDAGVRKIGTDHYVLAAHTLKDTHVKVYRSDVPQGPWTPIAQVFVPGYTEVYQEVATQIGQLAKIIPTASHPAGVPANHSVVIISQNIINPTEGTLVFADLNIRRFSPQFAIIPNQLSPGVYTFEATARGQVRAVASASYTYSGTSSGFIVPVHNGTGAGSYTYSGAGAGAASAGAVLGSALGNYSFTAQTASIVDVNGSASGSYRGTGIDQAPINALENRWLDLIRDAGSGSPSSNFRYLGGDVTDVWGTGGDDIAWCGADWFAGTTIDEDDTFTGGALPFRNGVVLEATPGTFATQVYAAAETGVWLNAVTQGGEASGTHWWPIAAFNDGGTNRILCWHIDGDASTPWGTQLDSCIVTLNVLGGYSSHVNCGFGSVTDNFWVDGILVDTDNTYIYGEQFVPDYDADLNNDGTFPNYGKVDPENHYTLKRVARVPNGSILTLASWEFWDGSDWTSSVTDAAPMVDTSDVEIHGDAGVRKIAEDHYILAAHTLMSEHIDVYRSTTPEGPWTPIANVPVAGYDVVYQGVAYQIGQLAKIIPTAVHPSGIPANHSVLLMSRNLLNPSGGAFSFTATNIRRYAPQFVIVPNQADPGVYTFEGTAIGTAIGTASGSYTYSGTSSGLVTKLGSALGNYTTTRTGAGLVTKFGAATANHTYSGIGTGQATSSTGEGTAASNLTYSGIGTGQSTKLGSASGTYTATSTGSGLFTKLGTSASNYTTTGTGTGSVTAGTFDGAASGSYTATGTASGILVVNTNLITTTTTLHQPSAAVGSVNVTPINITISTTVHQAGIASGQAFINANLLTASTTFHQPSVTTGPVNVAANLITASTTLHSPSVRYTVAANLLTTTTTLHQPSTRYLVEVGTITDGTTVHNPVVAVGSVTANANLLTTTTTVHNPSVAVGVTLIGVNLLSDDTTIHNPSVNVGPTSVVVSLLTTTTTLHQPNIAIDQFVSVNSLTASTTILDPSIAVGAAFVDPNLLVTSATIHNPAIVVGSVTIEVGQIELVTSVHQPNVAYDQQVNVALLLVTATILLPIVVVVSSDENPIDIGFTDNNYSLDQSDPNYDIASTTPSYSSELVTASASIDSSEPNSTMLFITPSHDVDFTEGG